MLTQLHGVRNELEITHCQDHFYPVSLRHGVRYLYTMDESPIYQRIKSRLDELGLSERKASMLAVGNSQFIRNIRKGQSVSPRGENISKLAKVLQVSESWLLGTSDDPSEPQNQSAQGIRYGGIVEATAFRPNDVLNQDAEYRTVPIAPDPRYPPYSQFAFQVVGDSMDQADMRPGSWVQAVEIHAWQSLHGEPRDGTFVIVARTRNGDDERELTVKRLRIYRDRIELCPESSNPKHKPIVFPNPPQEDQPAEGQIIAIVISSHRLYV